MGSREAFVEAVEGLRRWTDTVPLNERRGSWDCDYDNWREVHATAITFLADIPFSEWTDAEIDAVLFALARDNECEILRDWIEKRGNETVIAVADFAIAKGEQDARWQVAKALGKLVGLHGVESRLLALVADTDEYVRRISLSSLALVGSARTEELAISTWNNAADDCPWTRMMALWALRQCKSSKYERHRLEAERSAVPYLSDYARKMRTGEIAR